VERAVIQLARRSFCSNSFVRAQSVERAADPSGCIKNSSIFPNIYGELFVKTAVLSCISRARSVKRRGLFASGTSSWCEMSGRFLPMGA
jgi:hypothetical protein